MLKEMRSKAARLSLKRNGTRLWKPCPVYVPLTLLRNNPKSLYSDPGCIDQTEILKWRKNLRLFKKNAIHSEIVSGDEQGRVLHVR
jgi:hypothetical protein